MNILDVAKLLGVKMTKKIKRAIKEGALVFFVAVLEFWLVWSVVFAIAGK